MAPHRHQDVAAFLLAGGASSRMGRPKGLIELAGEPLILRTSRLIKPLVSSVSVVGPARTYRPLGLTTIPDRIPGLPRTPAFQGPLAGIVTALGSSTCRWNLILACDLPYLSEEWIEGLLARAEISSAQALLPSTAGGLEPLAAVYRIDAHGSLLQAFQKGIRKVTEALQKITVETIAAERLAKSRDKALVLKNMNTPDDLSVAQKWWSAKERCNQTPASPARTKRNRRRVPRRSK